ncbi:hypothetical protein ANTRET_LOCUS6887 [Anthophora retusa]
MSCQRFLFLLTAVRFDDADIRAERIAAGETAAPISESFQKFVNNGGKNYTCFEYATVDKMIVPFRRDSMSMRYQYPQKKVRCFLCPCSKDRKHPTTCDKCKKGTCNQHSTTKNICSSCNNDKK